jgi:transcriptional regulator with XRE-family HTH domain
MAMTLNDYMRGEGMTDDAMSKKIGVSRSAVTQYRLGDRMPKPEILVRLVEATNKKVSPMELAMGLKRGK